MSETVQVRSALEVSPRVKELMERLGAPLPDFELYCVHCGREMALRLRSLSAGYYMYSGEKRELLLAVFRCPKFPHNLGSETYRYGPDTRLWALWGR